MNDVDDTKQYGKWIKDAPRGGWAFATRLAADIDETYEFAREVLAWVHHTREQMRIRWQTGTVIRNRADGVEVMMTDVVGRGVVVKSDLPDTVRGEICFISARKEPGDCSVDGVLWEVVE